MALHKDFPRDPYKILDPNVRWFPADEDLREQGYEKLLPPFVPELRKEVKKWRDDNYKGASATSVALLNWWFKEKHTTYGAVRSCCILSILFCPKRSGRDYNLAV